MSEIIMSSFAKNILDRTYSHFLEEEGRLENWDEIASRVTKNVMKAVGVNMRQRLAQDIYQAIVDRKFIPGGRYLYASGNLFHQTNNCLLTKVYDSREGWAELLNKASLGLMSGAGLGTNYSDIRCEGSPIRKTGGIATGPISLMQIVNECGRGIMQGGNRRSAIWAGLNWKHSDIHKFIRIKNWSQEIRDLKAKDFSFPATLDYTNISVGLDDEFFEAYHDDEHANHSLANGVYWAVIEQMLQTGEPGFTVDVGKNAGEILRNACGEVASRDTDDICNLGSLNLSRIESLEEFKKLIDIGTAFLLAGSVYSDVPYSDVDQIRSKNRRLGLGLMGVHEWLLKRGKCYAPDEELGTWLNAYTKSGRYANKWADEWNLSHPKKTRAIAPNGTTGIVAETTGGIEPIFCVAYKRRYLKGNQYYYQYVIDPCAKRLIDSGIDPSKIEDAYTLARDVERRIAFQAWVQEYVDHCISSTINLPEYGSELNNRDLIRPFGSMLMRYLPSLRGITCYPEGSRSGQPLTPVPYTEAINHEGAEILEESMNVCSLKGGSCGD
jgi:ribonucleoside-diphosphate reductase alpha chain